MYLMRANQLQKSSYTQAAIELGRMNCIVTEKIQHSQLEVYLVPVAAYDLDLIACDMLLIACIWQSQVPKKVYHSHECY